MHSDPIPKFNQDGYLPQGEHRASLDEIKQIFGISSPVRKELWGGFESLVKLLQKHRENIKTFLLDGSFVTSKESPGDFDCILVLKEGFDFKSTEAEKLRNAKQLFNAHLFVFTEEDVSRIRRLVDFFGHDRDRKFKGLIEVIL
jgi:hypothetical protein